MNKNTHNLSNAILRLAKKKRRRVAIGLLESSKEIESYLKLASTIADIIIVGQKIKGFESYPAANPEKAGRKILELLQSERVDAVSKGQLGTVAECPQ